MHGIALVLGALVAGLVAAFATRRRPDARVALASGVAAAAGNVMAFVFC